MNQNLFYSWLSQKKRKKKRKKNHTCFAIIWHFQIILNYLNPIGDHSGFEEAAEKRLLTCFLEYVFWDRKSEQRVKLANGHFLPSYLPHSPLDATASHSPEEQFSMYYSLAVCPLFSSTPHTLKHLIQHFLLSLYPKKWIPLPSSSHIYHSSSLVLLGKTPDPLLWIFDPSLLQIPNQ